MTTTTLTPLPAVERIDNLDVLRGLALLGIALMNVEFFTSPLADMGGGIAQGADRATGWRTGSCMCSCVASSVRCSPCCSGWASR